MTNILASRAMLSAVTIRQWTARKLDKRITAEVAATHGAGADAGRYNKALIARDALAAIVTAANAARTEHYARTLPWLDDGARVLPAAGYLAYSETMRALRSDFESAVESFLASYPSFVDDARQRLNGMFNEADYPSASEIRTRFAFAVRMLPMPDAADFRVELANGQADAIRAEIEAATREALETAMRDAWQRISDVVGRMVERLNAYKPGAGGYGRTVGAHMTPSGVPAARKTEGIFRDSLVENIRELCAVLPSFNLTNNPQLTAVTERMERELCAHGAADLRESDVLRQDTAKAAESILADVSAYLV